MLSWSQVTDAQYYDVEVSKYEDFRTTIVKSSRTISNYVQIIELTPSTLYYWRVRVVANNIDGLWSKISKFKTYVKLEAPVLESPYNNTERVSESTVFSWNTLFYNPDYEIQFSLFSDFKNVDTSFTIGSANTSISNLKLKYETKYYWKVRGVVGDESGPWSAVYSFITLGKLPDKIVCMKPASEYNHYANYKMPNQIFIWLKDPYSDSYMIQFSADSNFQILVYQQSKIKDTSVFIYDIKSDYRFWRVRGENQWGAGEWSERKIFNFTLPVEKISEVPDKFKLMQNYPNPFNPSTKIRYYLPERAQVFLSIFDVLGRIVEEYDKGIQDVGCHEIIWEPKSSVGEISGGTYFYKLQAGKFTDVRKLVYLK
jgi:hypothetical protein